MKAAIRLVVASLLLLPAAALAAPPMLPYDTCNKGMAPPKCTCEDMKMVEENWYANKKAKDAWQTILDSKPKSLTDARQAFADARIKDAGLVTRMASCDTGSQLTLGLSNWFSPVFNSCYCETTCDVMVMSTRKHEETHGSDQAENLKTLAYLTTTPAGQAVLIFAQNRLFADLGCKTEIHAHDEQAKYQYDQMRAYIDQGCTWEPFTPPPASPPPAPKGVVARMKALAQRVIDGPRTLPAVR